MRGRERRRCGADAGRLRALLLRGEKRLTHGSPSPPAGDNSAVKSDVKRKVIVFVLNQRLNTGYVFLIR